MLTAGHKHKVNIKQNNHRDGKQNINGKTEKLI